MTTANKRSVFEPEILFPAIRASFTKLDPRHMVKNPVMFVTEIGALVTTFEILRAKSHGESLGFVLQICLWLWFTVLFANFAEALAEGRGKAQADALRRGRKKAFGRRLRPDGTTETVPSELLRKGDEVARRRRTRSSPPTARSSQARRRSTNRSSPASRRPVLRESGGDRSAVTGGTTVLSDQLRDPRDRRPRRELPRPDDLAHRGGQAPEDAERDRAQHPALGAHHHLPARLLLPAALRRPTSRATRRPCRRRRSR